MDMTNKTNDYCNDCQLREATYNVLREKLKDQNPK